METAKAAGAAITLAAINFAASIPSVPNKHVGWNKHAGEKYFSFQLLKNACWWENVLIYYLKNECWRDFFQNK